MESNKYIYTYNSPNMFKNIYIIEKKKYIYNIYPKKKKKIYIYIYI